MEVMVEGITVEQYEFLALEGGCPGWCTYNPDSNCWDDGD